MVRAKVVVLEGTTEEITEELTGILEDLQKGGSEVIDVKVTHAREHGIDGFTVVYTIVYKEG